MREREWNSGIIVSEKFNIYITLKIKFTRQKNAWLTETATCINFDSHWKKLRKLREIHFDT